jgi:hypothetical protein
MKKPMKTPMMKIEAQLTPVRRSRARGSVTEWVILIVVAVALGLPMVQYVFGKVQSSGNKSADKIEAAQNGQSGSGGGGAAK